jgi:hypothetical protein
MSGAVIAAGTAVTALLCAWTRFGYLSFGQENTAGMWLGSIVFLRVLLEAMRVIQTQRSVEERAG